MSQSEFKFLFSVIIPVYNVEDYIDEAIESILNQTIGFKNNIQLVLVDDGSTDRSPEICKKYQNQYPHNIKFIQQKNQGPAVARDTGAKAAEGKYLSLPDSDDKLSHNALKEVYDFFEVHYDEIDVVTIPWEYFEARTGRDHPLNGKFYKSHVVDLSVDYTDIVGSVAPSFFKAEVFENHQSNPAVGKYSEDLRFMGEVLLDKQKYGVVRDAVYYYRKRKTQTSSQDGNVTDKFWYLETPKTAIESLLEYAKAKNNGVIPKFTQFMAIYELQWRIKRYGADILSNDEKKQYKDILKRILNQVDDKIIAAVWNITPKQKIFTLDLKNGNKKRTITYSNNGLYYNDILLESTYTCGNEVFVDFIRETDGFVEIEVNYTAAVDNAHITLNINDQEYEGDRVARKPKHLKVFVDETVDFPTYGYVYKIPIQDIKQKSVQFLLKGVDRPLKIRARRFSRLSPKNKFSYACLSKLIVIKNTYTLRFTNNNVPQHTILELKYIFTLLFRYTLEDIPLPLKLQWKMAAGNRNGLTEVANRGSFKLLQIILLPTMFIKQAIHVNARSAVSQFIMPFVRQTYANLYMTLFRVLYYVTLPFYKHRNLWMFMDRVFEADDSAEILFEYVVGQNNTGIEPYFTVKKSTSDFVRLSKIGRTIPFLSQYQKLLFLHTKKVISSHADDIMINPFQGFVTDINDIYQFEYIFLQHGIIKDDISDWLNRYNKNINLFVTSVKGEYQSILDYQYFYDESVVKLTGLPRYDRFENNPEKKIALAPTWRNHLATETTDADREHWAGFKDTYYYKYYQSFITDKKLNDALKKYGYTMQFYIHPSFRQQYVDFIPGKFVDVKKLPYNYKKVKSVSSLMITDFSSVAFDFAYLRKPIIYGQFDEDIFWSMHMSTKGYFSYRDNGLGPVTTDLESTVDMVIKYMKNGCKLEEKYERRINEFFAFDDKNNSERVYQAILEQDREKVQ